MVRMRSRFRCALLATVAIGMLVPATSALAQDQRRIEFQMDAGDLGEALKAVSRQSGKEIIFTSEAVLGRSAPALHGTYSADQAVRALLEGSDLVAQFRKDVIIIRGRSQPSGEVTGRSTESADIVVTGSRIRGAPSASPTVVRRREELLSAGQTDLGEFIRSLPQNFSGGQNPGVAGGGNQGGNENISGSSTLNLRGLGPSATLTLINGHRVAYDSLSQGVDISQIPVAAIDRIELVADGASALYGSDAVGGVANVILRKDYNGLLTSARFGASTDGGNAQQQYGILGGSLWDGGGFFTSVDYSKNSPITARNRDYTSVLDDTASLLPGQRQIGILIAGHQSLTDGVELKLDGQFNDRKTTRVQPFLTTSNALTNGLISHPHVQSFSVSPSLDISLPANWRATFSGTYSESNNHVFSRRYAAGIQTLSGNIDYDNRLKSIEASTEGPTFALPGGTARLAVGGGFREAGLGARVTTVSSTGVTATTTNFNKARQIYFAYAEASLPFINSANAIPLIDELSVSAAIRYENYKGVADLFTPKFGVIYRPIPGVTLRSAWGRAFKAQTLYQEFQIRQGVLFPGSVFPGAASSKTVFVAAGGNDNLKPEKATTWTATLEVQPQIIPGLTVQASYFHVNYKDRVVQPLGNNLFQAFSDPIYAAYILLNPSSQFLAEQIARLPQGLSNATGQPYDPASVGGYLDASLQNAATQKLEGVDLSAEYRMHFENGDQLSLSASASYLKSDQQLSAGQPTVQLAGLIFNPPHWRWRAGSSWEHANVSLSGYANYISGTTDNRYNPAPRVDAFTSVDLVGRIRLTATSGLFSGIDATLSVLNLFNEKPSKITNTNLADPPYDSSNYSVVGRVVSLTLTKSW